MNKWKLTTILLIVLITGIIVYTTYQNNVVYNFGGVEVTKINLEKLTKTFQDKATLCNLESNKCTIIKKLK
jgi:Tfp pilus assembly protein PilO